MADKGDFFLYLMHNIIIIIKNNCVIANSGSRKINFKYSFHAWKY